MKKVSLSIIHPCEKKETCLICVLKEAITKVELKYYYYPYKSIVRKFQKPERAFTSELYHQLRTIQENEPQRCNIAENIFQVEISKTPANGLWKLKCGSHSIQRQRIVPDLVFHNNQNNTQFQGVVCEVKTSENISIANFIKDLEKLLIYKGDYLKFDNSCFIFLGSKETLLQRLKEVNNLIPDLIKCVKEKEIIFIVKDNQSKTNVYKLN